jgi:hypothetical protein
MRLGAQRSAGLPRAERNRPQLGPVRAAEATMRDDRWSGMRRGRTTRYLWLSEQGHITTDAILVTALFILGVASVVMSIIMTILELVRRRTIIARTAPCANALCQRIDA